MSLPRGAWFSASHEATYGKNFKMRGVRGWAGSRRFKALANAAALRSLDVYQFGVYTGGSMRGLAHAVRGFGQLYGFDSFIGLPAETEGVALEGPHWRPGAFSAADALGSYSVDGLLANLRERVGRANVTLIPGFYNDSLTDSLRRRFPFQPALLVDVDVDLHSSAVQCLTWMLKHRLIVAGTLVRYDDWRNMRQRHGEARAHRELTRRFNITWSNLAGRDGKPNSREWQVVSVGGRRARRLT